jgi:hypothetical protein
MIGPDFTKSTYGNTPKVASSNIHKSLSLSNFNSSFVPFYLKRHFKSFTYAPFIYISGFSYIDLYKYFPHLQKPEKKITIDLCDTYDFSLLSKTEIYTISLQQDNIDTDIIISGNKHTSNFVLNELFHSLREKTGAIIFRISNYKNENTFIKSYCDLFFCDHNIESEDIRKFAPLSLIVNLEVENKKLCIDKTLLNCELKCLNN